MADSGSAAADAPTILIIGGLGEQPRRLGRLGALTESFRLYRPSPYSLHLQLVPRLSYPDCR